MTLWAARASRRYMAAKGQGAEVSPDESISSAGRCEEGDAAAPLAALHSLRCHLMGRLSAWPRHDCGVIPLSGTNAPIRSVNPSKAHYIALRQKFCYHAALRKNSDADSQEGTDI